MVGIPSSWIERERVAPNVYWDEGLYEAELDLIFRTYWVFVAHRSEVPAPGDYRRKTVAGQELLVVHGDDGQIRVFFNRCPHRGNLVCMADGGSTWPLRCAYHGWTFGEDGALKAVPRPDAYGDQLSRVKNDLGLAPPFETASYGGFVFCRLQDDPSTPNFDDFIAPVRGHIDQLLALSPEGEIDLSGGWIGHRLYCNWKMVVEANVDNYHVTFVHRSLLEAIPGAFDTEEDRVCIRHLGMGHTEVDFRLQYRDSGRPLHWAGVGEGGRLEDYVGRMRARYGAEEADRRLVDGPPHTMIFPNLFLSQMNIMVVDPLGSEMTAAYTTPVFLRGADELNRRTALQCSGAMGPAGMIIADDAEIGDRNQVALHTVAPAWLELSRGVRREHPEGGGEMSYHGSDETAQRGIWWHYRTMMSRRGEQ